MALLAKNVSRLLAPASSATERTNSCGCDRGRGAQRIVNNSRNNRRLRLPAAQWSGVSNTQDKERGRYRLVDSAAANEFALPLSSARRCCLFPATPTHLKVALELLVHLRGAPCPSDCLPDLVEPSWICAHDRESRYIHRASPTVDHLCFVTAIIRGCMCTRWLVRMRARQRSLTYIHTCVRFFPRRNLGGRLKRDLDAYIHWSGTVEHT